MVLAGGWLCVWTPGHLVVTTDSALYVGLARSLAAGQGYRFNQADHKLVPPGLAVLLAVPQRLVGGHPVAMHATIKLFALLLLVGVYLLTRHYLGACVGLAAVLMVGASPALLFWSHFLMTDVPFAALLVWGAYLLARWQHRGGAGRFALAAVVLAAAPLVRDLGVVLVPAVFLAVCCGRTGRPRPWARRLLPAALAAVLVAAPYAAWTARNFATPDADPALVQYDEMNRFRVHLIRAPADARQGRTGSRLGGHAYHYARQTLENWAAGPTPLRWAMLLALAAAAAVGLLVSVATRRHLVVWAVALMAALILYNSLGNPKTQPRYAAVFVPFVPLLVGRGAMQLWWWLTPRRSPRRVGGRAAVLLGGCGLLLLLAAGMNSMPRMAELQWPENRGDSRTETQLARWLAGHDPSGREVLVSRSRRVAALFTGRRVWANHRLHRPAESLALFERLAATRLLVDMRRPVDGEANSDLLLVQTCPEAFGPPLYANNRWRVYRIDPPAIRRCLGGRAAPATTRGGRP
jgi:4-amino-4-deoxy-L-arabinose transferase-like glycosyltransferase